MRILGIDFGQFSIKAVEVHHTFGQTVLQNCYESPLSGHESLVHILSQLKKQPDCTVIALSTHETTFRNLHFPTKDKKAIQASVGFELEDELPFALEESAYDYAILDQNKQSTYLHVATTLKSYVKNTLEVFQNTSFDPDIITSKAWAYHSLFKHLLTEQKPPTEGPPLLLLHIGLKETICYLHWHNAPTLIREIPLGGWHLTESIRQHLSISFEEAEFKKITEGSLEDSPLAACLKTSLQRWITELHQIDLIARHITHQNLHHIYLAGSTTTLPGLTTWLQEEIKIPTDSLSQLEFREHSTILQQPKFLLASALALSQIHRNQGACINFRKNEFIKKHKTKTWNTFQIPFLQIGIIFSTLCISLLIQSHFYTADFQTTQLQLEKSIRTFFGTLSPKVLKSYLADPNYLQSTVEKTLKKQRELTTLFGPTDNSAIDFLNKLSITIPKEITLDLMEFHYGQSAETTFQKKSPISIVLTFLVEDLQTSKTLQLLFKNHFSTFKSGEPEEISSTDSSHSVIKKWKITFTGKPSNHVESF